MILNEFFVPPPPALGGGQKLNKVTLPHYPKTMVLALQ